MSDRPARLFDEYTPMYASLCLEFARRELTDEKLAEVIGGWAK